MVQFKLSDVLQEEVEEPRFTVVRLDSVELFGVWGWQ